MTYSYNIRPRLLSRAAAARRRAVFILPLIVVAIAACNTEKLLDVNDVDVATPGSLETKEALPVVHAGAIGDFQVAYSGNGGPEGQITMSGMLADEWRNSETFPTRVEVDQRNIEEQNATMNGVMRDIQRARASADFASSKFEKLAPTDVRRAETMNLAGFAMVIMAENYCSGVPISRLTDTGELVLGEPRTTAQLLDDAIVKFDSATAIASGAGSMGTTQVDLARVGRGRALLNKADFNGAAAAVAAVPTSFVYQIFHSEVAARANNGLWVYQRIASRWTVTDREGINGLPYISDNDPRVPTAPAGRLGFDGFTPLIFQNKYPARGSPVQLANGVEARLIEAEAALRAGDLAGYTTALNASRSALGLGPLVPPATASAQQDQLFKERAYSLWFTSHRLGDLRRLIRQYGRGSETVFPTGAYFKGGNYGPDVNLIIPFDEKNNPSFKGCLDRNA